jgi:hypothetical protein
LQESLAIFPKNCFCEISALIGLVKRRRFLLRHETGAKLRTKLIQVRDHRKGLPKKDKEKEENKEIAEDTKRLHSK